MDPLPVLRSAIRNNDPGALQTLLAAYLEFKALPPPNVLRWWWRAWAASAAAVAVIHLRSRDNSVLIASIVLALLAIRAWRKLGHRSSLLRVLQSEAALSLKQAQLLGIPEEAVSLAGSPTPAYRPELSRTMASPMRVNAPISMGNTAHTPQQPSDVARALMGATAAFSSTSKGTPLGLASSLRSSLQAAIGGGTPVGQAMSPEAAFIATLSAARARKEEAAATMRAGGGDGGLGGLPQEAPGLAAATMRSPAATGLFEASLAGSPFRATGLFGAGSPTPAATGLLRGTAAFASPSLPPQQQQQQPGTPGPYMPASRSDRDAETRRYLAGSLGRSLAATAGGGPDTPPGGSGGGAGMAAITRATGLLPSDVAHLERGVRSAVARHFVSRLLPAYARNTRELHAANPTLPLSWLERRQRRARVPTLLLRGGVGGGSESPGVTLDDAVAELHLGVDTRYIVARPDPQQQQGGQAGFTSPGSPFGAPGGFGGGGGSSSDPRVSLWQERAELEAFLCPRRHVVTAAAAAAASASGPGSTGAHTAADVDPIVYGAARLRALAGDAVGMSGFAGDYSRDEGALTAAGGAGAAYVAALAAAGEGGDPQGAPSSLPSLPSDAELLLNYVCCMGDEAVAEDANAAARGGGESGALLARRISSAGRRFSQRDGLFSRLVVQHGPGGGRLTPSSAGLQPSGVAALSAGLAAEGAPSGGGSDEERPPPPPSARLVVPRESPAMTALVSISAPSPAAPHEGGGSGSGAAVLVDPGNELPSRVSLPRALGLTLHLLLTRDGGRVGNVPAKAAITRLLGGLPTGAPAAGLGRGEGAFQILEED